MTKKELKEAVERLGEQNVRLIKSNNDLIEQRDALVNENLRLTDHEDIREEIVTALGENLLRSLKAKNVINLKPDEKDALYYMLERYMQLTAKPEDFKEQYIRSCMNICN